MKTSHIFAILILVGSMLIFGCLGVGELKRNAADMTYGQLRQLGGQIECTYNRGNSTINLVLDKSFVYAKKGNDKVIYTKSAEYVSSDSSFVPGNVKKDECDWYAVTDGYEWTGPSSNDTVRTYLSKVTEFRKIGYTNLRCEYVKTATIKAPTQNVCRLN